MAQMLVSTTTPMDFGALPHVPSVLRNLGPGPVWLLVNDVMVFSEAFPVYPGEAISITPVEDLIGQAAGETADVRVIEAAELTT